MKFKFGKYDYNKPLTIPANTPNYTSVKFALNVGRHLDSLTQLGWGHLITNLNNTVKHEDPMVREAIQSNVNELAEALGLIYAFSIWEHFEETLTRTQREKIYSFMTYKQKNTFLAYKHIRHTFAHSFSGKRAKMYRVDFESKMGSDNPLKGLTWNKDSDTLDLSSTGIALQCLNFMKEVAREIVGNAANPLNQNNLNLPSLLHPSDINKQ